MIVKVHMLAFNSDRNVIRKVDIPVSKSEDVEIEELLELVFKYGQNDFQPQDCYSVSVGDVAEFEGMYWLCCSVGWKELSEKEFNKLVGPTCKKMLTFCK